MLREGNLEKTITADQENKKNPKIEGINKIQSTYVLEMLKNYLEDQQKVEDAFQEMRQDKGKKSAWEDEKINLEKKYNINKITEQMLDPDPNRTSIDKSFSKNNIKMVRLVRELGLGALSEDEREKIKAQVIDTLNGLYVNKDLDEITNPETGRLKRKVGQANVKNTGLESFPDEFGAYPHVDKDLMNPEDIEDDFVIKEKDPQKFIPIQEVGNTYENMEVSNEEEDDDDKIIDEDLEEIISENEPVSIRETRKYKQQKQATLETQKAKEAKIWESFEKNHFQFKPDILKSQKNYFLDTLGEYLKLQDEVETNFNLMAAHKKLANKGKANQYGEMKQAWNEVKTKLSTYKLPETIPQEIKNPANPLEFIRKYNLSTLNMDERQVLIDSVKKEKTIRDQSRQKSTQTRQKFAQAA